MHKNEVAKKRIKEILGDRAEEIIKILESISPDFAKYAVNVCYGDIYIREGFSDKSRELAAVACLIGQGNTSMPLYNHLSAMFNVGWTKEEIIELIIFLTIYAGFPACISALTSLKKILLEKSDVMLTNND